MNTVRRTRINVLRDDSTKRRKDSTASTGSGHQPELSGTYRH
jgi:hypothetical protein